MLLIKFLVVFIIQFQFITSQDYIKDPNQFGDQEEDRVRPNAQIGSEEEDPENPKTEIGGEGEDPEKPETELGGEEDGGKPNDEQESMIKSNTNPIPTNPSVSKPIPSLCDNPTIDAAVRADKTKHLFLFKDQYYWILDTSTSRLSDGKRISDDFKSSNKISQIESSWVQNGIDSKYQTEGDIILLVKDMIMRFSVKINSETSYKFQLSDSSPVAKLFNITEKIRAVTQVATFQGMRQIAEISQDILVLHGDKYSLFFNREGMAYEVFKLNLDAKSEVNSNRLSIFDSKTRDQNYWNKHKSVPLKNVLDINAFAYFPNGQLYAIGKQHFCTVIIDSSVPDLVCNKKDIKELLGCPMELIRTSDNSQADQTELSVTLNIETESTNKLSLKPTISEAGGEDEADEPDKPNIMVMVLIGGIIVLFVLILVVMVIVMAVSKTSSSSQVRNLSQKSLSSGPTDPRYGQIDSQLNLHMKIATPSVTSIDMRADKSSSREQSS